MFLIKTSKLIIAIALITISIAAQGTPNDLRDLVGARASSGESELQRRGYGFVKTIDGNDRKWSNYWSNSRRICITVATVNGRYEAITTAPSFDCNRDGNSGGNSSGQRVSPPSWARGTFYGRAPNGTQITLTISNDGSVSANIGGGMSYGSYTKGNYLNMGDSVSRVERQGDGFSTTRTDNGERIVYGRNFNGNNNGGGYKVNVDDLVGARASSGESEMRNRGFRNVDGFKQATTSYTIWWRTQSRQCIQVATANGRFDSVTDIQSHPRCK